MTVIRSVSHMHRLDRSRRCAMVRCGDETGGTASAFDGKDTLAASHVK